MPLAKPTPPREIELAPGDVVALLTDGIFETANAGGELLGVQPVEQVLCAHAHASAAELARHVLDQVTGFAAGRPQDDDITAVLLKRLPIA